MADIASLGIKITTTGAKEAARDLDKLSKEAEQAARAAGQARDSMGRFIKTAGDSAKASRSLARDWTDAGRAIGVGLAGAFSIAGLALRKYLQNSIEAEKVQAQLNATLRSTGGAAGLVIGELNEMAETLQAVTTFDDEAIGGVQGLLLTFTKIGRDVFPKATEAVLDMSVALGTDLRGAALQVGKALNDPVLGVTALARAGVQFSDAQKKVIKALVDTGRQAEAQAIILRELETQMGGSARAAADTLGGSITQLKNAFDNLLEGDASGGGLKETTGAVKELTRTLNDPDLKRGTDSVASGLIKIAEYAIRATSALGNAGQAYRDFLENRGFAQIDEDSTDAQIQARRVRVTGVLERIESGRTIFGPDTARKLRQELNGIAARVDAQTPLEKALGLDKLTSGQRFSAVPFSAVDFNRQAPGPLPTDEDKPKRGGGSRAAALTDEQRAAKALQEMYADLTASRRENIDLMGLETEESRTLYAVTRGELAALAPAQKENLLNLAREEDAKRQLLAAIAEEDEARKRNAEAIADGQARAADYIRELEFELALMGLSNTERQKAIALRNLDANATDLQRQRVAELSDELARGAELDRFRGALEANASDALFDFATDAKSATDAAKEFFDSMAKFVLRMIADQWAEKLGDLFSAQTKGASGGGGNLFGTILSSLLGGGREIGGPVSAGRLYPVTERGAPEVLDVGNTRYLIPPKGGQVTPVREGGGGGSFVQNLAVTIQGRPDRRSPEQFARASGREAARGMARTGR